MKKIIITFILFLILALLIFFLWPSQTNKSKSPASGDEPVACTQDAKLCLDGSYVSRQAPDCNFTPCPKEDLIQVREIQPNQKISSPLEIEGQARGTWFFEASFPIVLTDGRGNQIAQAIAQTSQDWMTEDFISFQATLKFSKPETENGFLVFKKDNPSGLTENDDQLRVPVFFE